MPYNKPFLNYEKQIELLKKRNVVIGDREFALRVLRTQSYYTIINGYQDLFDTNVDKRN
ncbi:hypothetical protein [Dolosicoccus paucivorans]